MLVERKQWLTHSGAMAENEAREEENVSKIIEKSEGPCRWETDQEQTFSAGYEELAKLKECRLEAARRSSARRRAAETSEERFVRLEMQRVRDRERLARETPEERNHRLEAKRTSNMTKKALETPEEREARLQRHRALARERLARETSEEREHRLQLVRLARARRLAAETSEQKQARLEKNRERVRARMARETSEERSHRMELTRRRAARRRTAETPEQRLVRLEKDRLYFHEKIAKETPEEKNHRLAVVRLRSAINRATETPEQKRARLERDRICRNARLATETPEERNQRIEAERRAAARRREAETPEQTEARKERLRRSVAARLANETPEERMHRLALARYRAAVKRAGLAEKSVSGTEGSPAEQPDIRIGVWSQEEVSRRRKVQKRQFHALTSFLCQKFAFTNFWEKIILSVGIIFALLAGACLPVIILLFADLVTIFIQYQLKKELRNGTGDASYFQSLWANHMRFTFVAQENLDYDAKNLAGVVEMYALETSFLGIMVFIFTFAYASILKYVAQKQMKRLRIRYFTSILNLTLEPEFSYNETYLKIQRNLQRFENSIGDSFGTMILSFSVFITCIVIAFLNHIVLTAMLVVVFPVMAVIMFFAVVIYRYLIETEKNHYQIAENLARDVFLNIQTVKAYEGEAVEVQRYDKLLITSQSAGANTTMFFDFIVSILYILLYTSYALTFWQGLTMALELKNRNETPDILIIVNFCIQISFVNFLKVPIFVMLSRDASQAYEEMTEVIRKSDEENSLKKLDGIILNDVTYDSVYFKYPKRGGSLLLNGVNARIPAGTFICIVGGPKNGKSTFLKLLVKLILPSKGTIHLGKLNLTELRGSWVRSRIGYVQQKTILFGDTIRDALKAGNNDVSDSEMISACRVVNVHLYIQSYQMGYDTALNSDLPDEVKEKIAIARILMTNPDILILDDCMNHISSLTQMAIIYEFLSQKQNSLVVVTSNIDIIKISDRIIHFKDGRIECGSYRNLIEQNSSFRSIISRQESRKNVLDFEPGVPQMRNVTNRARETSFVGMNRDEMVSHEITVQKPSSYVDYKKKGSEEKLEKKINCWKVLSLNRREFPYLLTAAIAATIMGFSIPAYASLFGESLGTIVLSSKEEIEDNVNFFPQMFLVAGIISGIARIVEGYMIAVSCSKLTKRLRKQTFEALIQKDVAFFDKEENQLSSLLYILRHDARIVPLAAGPEMVLFIKVAGIIIISTLVSVYHSWKLGLLVMGFSPFLFYGLYYISRFQNTGDCEESQQFERDLLKNRETIQVLNAVNYHMDLYSKLISGVEMPCAKTVKMKSLLFAYSQSVPFFAYAACMFYGGVLLQDDEITFTDFFKVVVSLILGTILVSQVLMIIPNRWPCLKSYTKILEIIPSPAERLRLMKKSRYEMGTPITIGFVKMKHVSFTHPYLKLMPKLQDINIQINERQTVIGLVGLLGSGNSIPIKLLLQFYTPSSGNIVIDDVEMNREFVLRALKKNIGLVDGNEKFFRRTVARNIAYSTNCKRDGTEAFVGMDDIVAVAKESDIHNFIITLPDGYFTIMTEEVCRGMTPGQVLRLSLARALLRDPRILLVENVGFEVDEDAQQLMETAIRRAGFARTVILASNYATSLANVCDCIYFFHGGSIKEFGKHQKLVEKQGLYYKLFEQQREQLKRVRESSRAPLPGD